MTFGHPWLLLTLLAVPAALLLYAFAQRRKVRYAVRFTNLEVLAPFVQRYAWRRYVPPALLALALASLSLGVARPHVKTLVPSNRSVVILVLDASRSMEAQDVQPSRLGAAQEAIHRFLNLVPKGLRIGFVVFAGEAQVGTPPTADHELVAESVDEIGRYDGFGGTAIGDALARAVELGQQALNEGDRTLSSASAAPAPRTVPPGTVSIVFLSDGRQNRGILTPQQGAERAKEAHIPVYTIALGTRNATLPGMPQGGGFGGFGNFGGPPPNLSPDRATLRQIAQITGGQYFASRTATSLRAAYTHLGKHIGRTGRSTEVTYAFVAAAAGLLLGAGLLSGLWAPRLP